MGIVLTKPRAGLPEATHTPGSEVGGASADDAMNLTTINQDLRQAYGKLAKLKGDDPSLQQQSLPTFDTIQDARSELAKIRRELQHFDITKISDQAKHKPLQKGHTVPSRRAESISPEWSPNTPNLRSRRTTIELKDPTPSLLLKSVGQ